MEVKYAQTPSGAIPLLEDMKALNAEGRNQCVSAMIRMIADLRQHGKDCRFIQHEGGSIYELKTRTSQGGPRVYFFVYKGVAYLCRAECKREDQANQLLLAATAKLLEAYRER